MNNEGEISAFCQQARTSSRIQRDDRRTAKAPSRFPSRSMQYNKARRADERLASVGRMDRSSSTDTADMAICFAVAPSFPPT
mmetsp:Transcript_3863/g.5290  ORF Transcript_3863/g.5290 Transcript_3863/m.5290 type:complete len:82 (-) Transcript_3863:252-497(-)